ncbi:MAG TPA: MFS transporter [Gaiellaceae bacterium]|nr:MFS transporter [Gaiellaceae bacterium]
MASDVEAAQPAAGPRAALSLIGSRRFGPYFVGNASSASGTWFQNLAAQLLVYRLTHSPFLLGLLNFCNFIPVLALAPWAGSAADRFDRRRLLIVTQLVATILSGTLAVLAWNGVADEWVVIGFALGLGVSSAYSAPASTAFISQLVERDELPSAVALNSMTFNIARAVGPVLAAVSVKALGIPASFAINAASYVIFIWALAIVEPRPVAPAKRGEARLRESLALVRRTPRLLVFLLIVAAVGFASDPVNTEAPALARAFGYHDTVAGWIIGAFGFGAVGAAFLVAGRVAGSRRRMIATLSGLGCGMIGLALSPWLALAFLFLVLAGFGYLASNTHATSRLQLEVEESLRGRIMALWSVAFLGLRPIASLLDGAIAGAFGVRAAAVCLAVPALAMAGVVRLRASKSPQIATSASP